ncbi:hypothetical protein CPC08DRAFT_688535 [Agrocybe pediades]|nr:hypothetical protein CPC08DRAFT_688535 [Agrocybe pediades]
MDYGTRDFSIGLTFPSISYLDSDDAKDIFEASLVKSKPACLEYWSTGPEVDGIILGCQDGTVFVLHCVPSSNGTRNEVPSKTKSKPRPAKLGHSRSGSASPTHTQTILSPTFNVTAKPRVVSGVNTEQVEAPKNYVDFEDEPDKLKDILKGKNPRERTTPSDTGSDKDKTPKSNASSIIEPLPTTKRKGAPRSLLSATNSRAPTPLSFSAPVSPQESNAPDLHQWELQYHIVPSNSGFGNTVTSVQFLRNKEHFAVLQASGHLFIFSSNDGSCASSFEFGENLEVSPSTGGNERPKPQDTWIWSSLSISYIEESIILIATATNDSILSALTPDTDEPSNDTSRCALLELVTTPSEIRIEDLAQVDFPGPPRGVGIYEEVDGSYTLYSTSHDGHLILRDFILRPPTPPSKAPSSIEEGKESEHDGSFHLSTLPLPNPFKSILPRSTESLQGEDRKSPAFQKSILSDPHDAGILIPDAVLAGSRTHLSADGKLYGLAWSHRELCMFEYSHLSMTLLCHDQVHGLEDAEFLDHETYVLYFEDRAELYQAKSVDADNDEINTDELDESSYTLHPQLIRTIRIDDYDAIQLCRGNLLVTKLQERRQQQQILLYALSDNVATPKTLWQTAEMLVPQTARLTSMLPLELELIIQGFSDGYLRQYTLSQMSRKIVEKKTVTKAVSVKTSDAPLSGQILGLHTVQNPRTKEKYIVGGADDGSIAFWSFSKFELLACWTIFNTPLARVVEFENTKTGPLRGCALCIARDGTVAVIVIDGFHFRYLIPGSVAPLKRICLGGNNLMMIYEDHHARLWDAQTKELWRSFGEDKVEEMLSQGGWDELMLAKDACVPKTVWSPIAQSFEVHDAAASLSLNLERVVVDAISITKTISTSRDEVREILLALDRLRLILSALLTPGLNEDVDSICYGKLGAYSSSVLVGLSGTKATVLTKPSRPQDVWCMSAEASACRALAIIAVLRAMGLFEELMEGANTVISFYSTSLAACVGGRFKAPSLELLGRLWFESSNELRQPIRTLFDATITNMSDETAMSLIDKWQHYVPVLQPDSEKESMNAALGLFICGSIASHKFTLMPINTLIDLSKSISLYLNDEKSIHRILAIDLCSRGFTVWQNYIDAMEILRSLFDLAATVKKDSISVQNISAQARLAILSIASSSMPIFLGTLCLDILTPPNMEHQRSVLHVLAFLIRKRPHILQSSLPRLMEAVVKSLDPNTTANREVVLDTATEIIGFVVKTFPTVDFHMATQRLAVGTNEGAVIMYDLKTAIRLYVLEGHKKQITACSFSPDGRRLITISLKDASVLVWKVGSSFASFFNPGAPPRQGHGGSEPFKTLNFNIGDEAIMSTAETLDLVRVEWIADRSVRVKIRQSVLTFST